MVIKRPVRGIAFVLMMMGVVWGVMASAPGISYDAQTPDNGTWDKDYINVSVTLSAPGGIAILNWNSVEEPMTGSGTNFYNNKSVSNGTTNVFFVRANDSTPANWSYSNTRTVNVNIPVSPPSITAHEPLNPVVNSSNGTIQNFNVTVDQNAFVSWKIDGVEKQNNSETAGVKSEYSNGTAGPATYTVTATAINANGISAPQNWTWNVQLPDPTPPSNITSLTNISGPTWIKWTWTNPTTDFDHAEVHFDGSFVRNITTNNYNTSPDFILVVRTTHNISLRPVDAAGNVGNWTNHTASTAPNPPSIERSSPSDSSFETIGTSTKNFTIKVVDQTANLTWTGAKSQTNLNIPPGGLVNLTFTPSTTGTYYINVSASNENGTSNPISWTWTVRPKTYLTGNRVWDGSKAMSLTYTWSPMSFYGFYYDVDSDVGNESLTIYLDSINDRSVQKYSLKYSTTPNNVSFKYKPWGGYDVIGFMADKYFVGYTAATSTDITDGKTISTLSYNQLHKILRDDNNQTAVYVGSSLTLGEGYVLKVNDVGTGRIVMLSLLKDGGVVDTGFVETGKTYKYVKRVGSANDLPIIVVHIESVFQGSEASAAFIKGIFQISESYTAVNSNNRYGIMEITDASINGINMENRDSITLSQGATIDIMGDIKFVVADDPNVLRFAPIVVRSGTYEVRGTISANDTSFEWNPMNFEGFYYNLNNDVGTEKLTLTRSGTVVSKDNLIYTTTAQPVSFKYKNFGQFNVVGFMADKYFAGYIANQGAATITKTDISTLGYKQLHRVLVDDDAQRIIYAGSTLTMNEGYVIKIKDVNMGAGSAQVWLSLLKDGNEVFDDIKNEGETFTYAPSKTGNVKNLPILALHIDKIFRGTEATAAFAKGAFQISETYTTISNGNDFGLMEISNVNDTMIEMKNPSSLTLSPGSTMNVMGNIKFRVADDSTTIRFYPFIMANGSALAANQLSIDVPASPMVRDTITITVTSGSGTPVENAEVSFDSKVIGNTNSTGKLDYLLISSGQHTIAATKLGYDKATKTITVSEYRDITLKFEIPPVLDQGIPVSIKVVSNGTAVPGANVTFNGASIGRTDSSGILSYTFDVSGTHNLGASKAGYISVLREITVRAPFTEFKALDINFKPNVIFRDQKFLVWANITNVGTKNGTLPVGLLINDTVIENKNVTLAPGLIQEVSFTPKVDLSPGNYTVEILGQKKTLELKEEPVNILLVGGIVTALGSVVIYLSTTLKGKETIDMLTKKFNVLMASQKK